MLSKYRLIIGSINQMIIQQQLTAGFGKPAVNHHRCLTGGFLIILSTLSAAFNCNNTLAYYCSLLYSSMTALISTSLLLIPVDPNPLDSTADVSPSDELPSSSSSDSVSTSSGHVHLACTPSSRPKRRLWRTAQDPIHRKLAAMSLLSRIRWGSPRREGNLALRRPMQCSTQTLKPESLMLKIRFCFGRDDGGGFLYGMIECFVSG